MNQMMPETTTTIMSDCESSQCSHRQSMVQQAFAATQQAPSPRLWISQRQVVTNYQSLCAAFPECPIFYALKCNPNHAVLETLIDCGSGFEIASMAELDLMRQLEVPPEKMVCFHPIKSPAFLQALYASTSCTFNGFPIPVEQVEGM